MWSITRTSTGPLRASIFNPSCSWMAVKSEEPVRGSAGVERSSGRADDAPGSHSRSEEHTSELQSLRHLVCRLLLEKKKKKITDMNQIIIITRTTVICEHLSQV